MSVFRPSVSGSFPLHRSFKTLGDVSAAHEVESAIKDMAKIIFFIRSPFFYPNIFLWGVAVYAPMYKIR